MRGMITNNYRNKKKVLGNRYDPQRDLTGLFTHKGDWARPLEGRADLGRSGHEAGKVGVQAVKAGGVETGDAADVAVRANDDDRTLVGRDAPLGVQLGGGVLRGAAVRQVVRVDVLAVDPGVVRQVLELHGDADSRQSVSCSATSLALKEQQRLTSHSVCGVEKM